MGSKCNGLVYGAAQSKLVFPEVKQLDYSEIKYTNTHSGGSRRKKNVSIAAEKAANARPPPKAAFGPELRASTPPARNPEATELYMSFLARYWE
jgi:hypothetical protein